MSPDLIAIILGIVEGLTEFLPVSSTGHLILTGDLLSFTGEAAKRFEVIIQLGAILSVLLIYRQRFFRLLRIEDNRISNPGIEGISGMAKLGLVSLPALAIGAVAHKAIKGLLFYPRPVAIALLTGAVLMICAERFLKGRATRELETMSMKDALIIGLFQCLALWPGMSRSASTICGAMLLGFSRGAAAEFSFLAAVPVLAAAAGMDLLGSIGSMSGEELRLLGIGFVTSFVAAWLAIKVFVQLVSSTTLVPFAIYRIALGILVLSLF